MPDVHVLTIDAHWLTDDLNLRWIPIKVGNQKIETMWWNLPPIKSPETLMTVMTSKKLVVLWVAKLRSDSISCFEVQNDDIFIKVRPFWTLLIYLTIFSLRNLLVILCGFIDVIQSNKMITFIYTVLNNAKFFLRQYNNFISFAKCPIRIVYIRVWLSNKRHFLVFLNIKN